MHAHLQMVAMLCCAISSGLAVPVVAQAPPETSYKVDAKIDLEQGLLFGEMSIAVRTHGQSQQTIAIDRQRTPTENLTIRQGESTLHPVDPNARYLVYPLVSPLTPNEKLLLQAEFTLRLRPTEDGHVRLADWFPRLYWGMDPTLCSTSVRVDAPSGCQVAITGRLDSSTGRYEAVGARTHGVCVLKGARVLEREVEGVNLRALYYPDGERTARHCFETAADVIGFYRAHHGFYPQDFLTIIPWEAEPLGGFPFATGVVAIHGQPKYDAKPDSHWTWITAHEIGHQYWMEYVLDGEHGPNYSWLLIGLGIHADAQYMRARNLTDAHHLDFLHRYLKGVGARLDTTIDRTPEAMSAQKFDVNNILIHGKGYSVISALESVLGQESFDQVYRDCLQEFGGRPITTRDFWALAERVSERDLDWFFEQWVRSNRYLAYRISDTNSTAHEGGYRTTVTVDRLGTLSMPIPVEGLFKDGTKQHATTNRLLDRNTVTFVSSSPLAEARLDPDKRLAMRESPLPPNEDDTIALIRRLPWTDADTNAVDLAHKQARDVALEDSSSWLKLALVYFDAGDLDASFEAWEKFEALIEAEDEQFLVRTWKGIISDCRGEREAALRYYQSALQLHPSSPTRHGQFNLTIDREFVRQRLETPYQR